MAAWSKSGGEVLIRNYDSLKRQFRCENVLETLRYYGFTGNGIRVRHPFITARAPM